MPAVNGAGGFHVAGAHVVILARVQGDVTDESVEFVHHAVPLRHLVAVDEQVHVPIVAQDGGDGVLAADDEGRRPPPWR